MSPEELGKYCEQHCYLSDIARKAVPRWVFITSVSAIISLALVFGGWQTNSLKAVAEKTEKGATDHREQIAAALRNRELYVESRIADAQRTYSEDVERFINAVRENREVLKKVLEDLEQVKIKQGKFEVKQDLVLKKIGLNNNHHD